ncbi:MAG TPA: cation transporter [Spirochaetota bacterium]|nr:cation transporter [Spirochaetota bacterium]HOL57180.1 cation transporter [Spirochaetota bacterium]HPP04796.1 cation transporter [Spirochaetota bacterium]
MSTRREKSINIKGMHCASCVALIENRVKSLKGVNNISVNLATEDANLIFDNSKISFENIKNEIEKLGYKVEEKDFNNMDQDKKKLI